MMVVSATKGETIPIPIPKEQMKKIKEIQNLQSKGNLQPSETKVQECKCRTDRTCELIK